MADQQPPQLFGANDRVPGVHVVLRVEDALTLRPQWDERDAAYFLEVCAAQIAAKMLDAGAMELARLIKLAEQLVASEEENNG